MWYVPFNGNKRVKWDHSLCPLNHPATTQHGGDIKPSRDEISKKLRDIEDDYDLMEPHPTPLELYFDASTDEPLAEKGSNLKEPCLDPTLPNFVPVDPKDPYSGDSQLRLTRNYQAIDSRINHYPMKGKKDYSSVEYPTEYIPPEQITTVELPTKSKKTEPVQDPVPRVKGI